MIEEEKTFRSYDDAKNFVITALQVRDYTSIEINKKRYQPIWVVKMQIPGINFYKKYISSEREK